MFYTTTQYNLAIGDKGQIPRVLKSLLYAIPEVRQAVPQVADRGNQSAVNDAFDETTQSAVEFFQKWQNLKNRDGRVNYETWIALGQFANTQNIELKNLYEPALKLMLTNTAAVSNTGAVLWPSKFGYKTHQNSVRRVLRNALSAKDLARVEFAVWDADRAEWQTVEFSHRHAMTPHGASQEDARKNANKFVSEEIQLAQKLERENNLHDAMLHLGYAIHCLQDATSPAHAGFRVYEGGHLELGSHVYEELFDPGPGSWLDEATGRGYKYFKNQLPCPVDYFFRLRQRRLQEKEVEMNVKVRKLILGGLVTAVLAAGVSWLLTSERSPLDEYLLWNPLIRNFWGVLNFPSYLAGALTAGNPHDVNEPVASAAFFRSGC